MEVVLLENAPEGDPWAIALLIARPREDSRGVGLAEIPTPQTRVISTGDESGQRGVSTRHRWG